MYVQVAHAVLFMLCAAKALAVENLLDSNLSFSGSMSWTYVDRSHHTFQSFMEKYTKHIKNMLNIYQKYVKNISNVKNITNICQKYIKCH